MGIPRGLRDFQAGWESRFFDFSTPRLFHSPVAPAIFSAACPSRDLFRLRSRNDSLYFDCPLHRGLPLRQHTGSCSPTFTPPQSGYFMSYLNWTFHGSTTLAVPLACSRGASCDRPAAKGDPLWEWAASVSWPWPPWVLLPELEPGLESPPKPPPYRDSESKRPSSHSNTVTLLLAGAYCRACAFTWKYRLSCRTTQSLPMTRPVSR